MFRLLKPSRMQRLNLVRLRLLSSLSKVYARRQLPPISSLSISSHESVPLAVTIKPEWRADGVLTFEHNLGGGLDEEVRKKSAVERDIVKRVAGGGLYYLSFLLFFLL